MFGMDSQRPAPPALPPGAAHRHENEAPHGRLDRRQPKGVGEKGSQGPSRGGRKAPSGGAMSTVAPKLKPGVRQGKLKLVPDDRD